MLPEEPRWCGEVKLRVWSIMSAGSGFRVMLLGVRVRSECVFECVCVMCNVCVCVYESTDVITCREEVYFT